MARTDDPFPLIKRLRAMGMPENTIYNRLLLDGWDQNSIAHAFDRFQFRVTQSDVATVEAAVVQDGEIPVSSSVAKTRSLSPLTLFFVLLVTGLAASGLGLYFRPPVIYSLAIAGAATSASSSSPELSYGAFQALSDPDYYASVKQNLLTQKASFIDANLSSMTLSVFKDGELTLSVPILAKGRPGSWWETPAGIYRIETKESMHYSTMGDVNMPYSLDFQGNFFIHGWPTYADGTPVSSSYSGGCIRLSTEDSKKVFDASSVGMPVVVYNMVPPAVPFSYAYKVPINVSATSYLIADLDSGTVLAQKNASVSAPIASITKLVTALVATEYINLEKEITVPSSAIVYTSVPRLKQGMKIKAYDLLFLLLQESSNEAAETLASYHGRDAFVSFMNAKARAIGLYSTTFNDPSGAKDDLSSPSDLFKLLHYIYDNRRFVFGLTTGEIADSAYGKPVFSNIANFNLVKAPAKLLGGKIGETNQAGETYAGVFSIEVGNIERKLAVIVLGAKDAHSDVEHLLTFVHNSYTPAQ